LTTTNRHFKRFKYTIKRFKLNTSPGLLDGSSSSSVQRNGSDSVPLQIGIAQISVHTAQATVYTGLLVPDSFSFYGSRSATIDVAIAIRLNH
jgi:hypothetical protein